MILLCSNFCYVTSFYLHNLFVSHFLLLDISVFCYIDEGGCPCTIQLTHPGSVCTRKMPNRCRPNLAHIRQSRPDSGLGFQVKVLKIFQDVPSSLESGRKMYRMQTTPFIKCISSSRIYSQESTCDHMWSLVNKNALITAQTQPVQSCLASRSAPSEA